MWKMLDDLAVTDSAAYAEMAKAGAKALVRILVTSPPPLRASANRRKG